MTKKLRACVFIAALATACLVAASGAGIAQTALTCTTQAAAQVAGGAGLVTGSASGQRKSWQPTGGDVTFSVRGFDQFDPKARVLVCFRWKTDAQKETFVLAEVKRIELSSDAKTLHILATVPTLPDAQDRVLRALAIVPIADVRILILNASTPAPVEVTTTLGITSLWFGYLGAFAVGVLAFIALLLVVRNCLRRAGIANVNPFLAVIATPGGYASLSQFQIVLWTFVVLISAVYVMLLSGELIQIATGTLVLLGISGAATIGSKAQGEGTATAPPAGTPPPPPPPAATLPARKPLWSDLITNINKGTIEIDVTRVQMLYFTLITAAFVAVRVFATYEIPEIPEGFQILMGISNSVYLGSKVVQK